MPFDFQPTLVGTLVELRPLRPEGAAELFSVASDPLVWEQHPDRKRYTPQVFDRLFRESLASGGALAVHDRRNGTIIGSSRFLAYDPEVAEVEIGYTFLARSYWGGAYNGEMKQLMLRHAFRFVQRVLFLIDFQNLRSQRATEKLGAVRVGSRPNAAGRESYVYAIARSAWLGHDLTPASS
ncbi:MAG: GNAT family N-acetyltransferase [Candidatus Tumulicola sp.]